MHVNNPNSDMLKELARAKDEMKASVRGEASEQTEELPSGSSPIEAREETSVEEETPSEETSAETAEGGESASETLQAAASDDDDEGPIRIGGREFKNSREAIAYAEELEREKLVTEAHAAGVREALEAARPVQQPEPEDDFESRFYANPKETLKSLKEEAKREALAAIQAESARERAWSDFLTEYPDIRRKDAERVLAENAATIGRMTDLEKAKKEIARVVRAEYEEIRNLTKPRVELSAKKQVSSPSGARPGVTPQKRDERPLSFAEQMKKLRGHT